MRRTTAAAIGTLTGTMLLLGAKLAVGSPPPPPTDVAADQEAPALDAPADEPSPTGPPASATATPTGPARKPTPKPTRTSATPRKTASTPARPRTGLQDGRFAGAASTNRYGTIKVTITVSGGRMTAVSATYPTSPEKTGEINARAIPRLKSEALAAQSANVATVSGATYTSDSFAASLQSALNAAKG